jgi:hypothetical protein
MDLTTQRLFFGSTAAAGGPYWLLTVLGDPTATITFLYGVTVDSSDNIYSAGYTNGTSRGASRQVGILLKTDTNGSVLSSTGWGGNTHNDPGNAVAVAPSGNIYFLVRGDNLRDLIFIKYNSAFSLQWQRNLDGPNGGNSNTFKLAIDSSENIYISTTTEDITLGQNHILTASYDSSGNLRWQRAAGITGVLDNGYNCALDSSSNVYVVGATDVSGVGTNTDGVILKYNSSGALQWQRTLGELSNNDRAVSCTVDAANNVYILSVIVGSPGGLQVSKYNSSGTLQWQRKIALTPYASGNGSTIIVDSNSNIYAVSSTTSAGITGTGDLIIVKYDSSGVLQWQRLFGKASLLSIPTGFTFDSNNDLIISGVFASPVTGITLKLPSDGSLTGTYSGWVYQTSSFVESAGSAVDAAGTLTDTAGTLTSGTPTQTGLAITPSTTLTTIP